MSGKMPTTACRPVIGRFFSIWERKSPRHSWECTHSFALCTHHSTEDGIQYVSVQTSTSGGWMSTGWTAFMVYNCRQLRKPVFDVSARVGVK